ncbi:MAG: DNA repair protein RecO [Planctomycetota bacterium]|jgi:DNA repair protein RecO (recombination protein O)
MQVKDTAICLRAVNYSETSQVVTLFTRDHGKVAAMAKGSRRAKSAFDGPVEVFSFGSVMFTIKDSGGQLAMLTEFGQQPRFRMLSQNLNALNAALFAAELTEKFLEDHDPHPPLFEKFLKFLEMIQETKDEVQTLAWLILYQLRLLEETGVAPMLDMCVNCGASINSPPAKGEYPDLSRRSSGAKGEGGSGYYFSSRENGLLCSACEMTFPEKRAIAPVLIDILKNPAKLPKTTLKNLKQIEQLLIYHFTELLRKPPRMAKYFA